MNVILNALSFAPGKMGGTETYFRNLYHHLQCMESDLSFRIICMEDVAEEFSVGSPNVERFAVRRYPKSDLRRHLFSFAKKALSIDYVKWHLKRLKGDLIHYPFSSMYPRVTHCPSVVTFLDLQHQFFPEFFTPRKWRQRDRQYRDSVSTATRIIAISNFTKQSLVDRYDVPPEKIDVAHLGIGADFRRVEDRQRLTAAVDKYELRRPFMYYPAATWPHKNHKNLLKALRLIMDRYGFDGDLVLTGVAKQCNSDVMQEIERLQLVDRVRFLGYLPYEELPAIYSLAQITVFPSLFEGFGIPLVEAMASGCPVVCSNVTSIPEVVGDAGAFFDPTSIEDMAEAIWTVWADDARRERMSNEGCSRASLFSWEATARTTVDVYRKALAEAR